VYTGTALAVLAIVRGREGPMLFMEHRGLSARKTRLPCCTFQRFMRCNNYAESERSPPPRSVSVLLVEARVSAETRRQTKLARSCASAEVAAVAADADRCRSERRPLALCG